MAGFNSPQTGGGIYLGIVGGQFARKLNSADEAIGDNPVVKNREYEHNSEKKSKLEQYFGSVEGKIEDIYLHAPEFGGEQIVVRMDVDGTKTIINIPFDNGKYMNSYGVDFAGRLCNTLPKDLIGSDVRITPYQIERDDKPGKFNTGVALAIIEEYNTDGSVSLTKIKSAFSKEGALASKIPQMEKKISKGKEVWDSSKRDEAIYAIVKKYIDAVGKIASEKAMESAVHQSAGYSPQAGEDQSEVVDIADITDDLPF